jgi:DNA-binding transcriptional regulator YbjK
MGIPPGRSKGVPAARERAILEAAIELVERDGFITNAVHGRSH